MDFFGDFGLRHKFISFTRWRHGTIVKRSRYRIWYLYINLAWTPQFSVKLLNRNCYRLSRVLWALAQISCFLCRLASYAAARILQHETPETEERTVRTGKADNAANLWVYRDAMCVGGLERLSASCRQQLARYSAHWDITLGGRRTHSPPRPRLRPLHSSFLDDVTATAHDHVTSTAECRV